MVIRRTPSSTIAWKASPTRTRSFATWFLATSVQTTKSPTSFTALKTTVPLRKRTTTPTRPIVLPRMTQHRSHPMVHKMTNSQWSILYSPSSNLRSKIFSTPLALALFYHTHSKSPPYITTCIVVYFPIKLCSTAFLTVLSVYFLFVILTNFLPSFPLQFSIMMFLQTVSHALQFSFPFSMPPICNICTQHSLLVYVRHGELIYLS